MFVCIKVISNILEVLLNFWLNTQKKSKNNGISQGFKCSLVFCWFSYWFIFSCDIYVGLDTNRIPTRQVGFLSAVPASLMREFLQVFSTERNWVILCSL